MLLRAFVRLFAYSLTLALASCASVDQFGGRVYDGNLNSQNALNQETLLNIVRASQYRAANFIGVSQIGGGQTETITTGLPSFGIGPHQTAAEHIYQISNSVSSGFSGSYQTAPLLTTAFQNGLLAPVDLKTISLLTSSHLRDVVFYALIDSMVVTNMAEKSHPVVLLHNDPTDNTAGSGDRITQHQADCRRKYGYEAGQDAKGMQDIFFDSNECSFAKFTTLLAHLIDYGLSAELRNAPAAQASAGTGTSGTTASTTFPPSTGYLCFDPTNALPGYRDIITADLGKLRCQTNAALKSSSAPDTVTTTTKSTKNGVETTITTTHTGSTVPKKVATISIPFYNKLQVEVQFNFRSPQQVYNYMGLWLRNRELEFNSYRSQEAQQLTVDHKYLEIVPSAQLGCYTTINYDDVIYCVPGNARHTAMLMDILEDLRNLNINPTDLNAPVTVRIAQ